MHIHIPSRTYHCGQNFPLDLFRLLSLLASSIVLHLQATPSPTKIHWQCRYRYHLPQFTSPRVFQTFQTRSTVGRGASCRAFKFSKMVASFRCTKEVWSSPQFTVSSGGMKPAEADSIEAHVAPSSRLKRRRNSPRGKRSCSSATCITSPTWSSSWEAMGVPAILILWFFSMKYPLVN